jgi:chromosome segregation ATPase
LNFLRREVGEENIFSAVVHMDERNPHIHICFVPLTKDKRLSAKEVMGGREKLVEWQDKFHDHMAAEFPDLERGQAAAVTKRKHVPTWLYKQAHRLTNEMTQLRADIESIGTFNAGKQKERILKRLLDWYPQINALEAKLKPYDEQIKILEYNARSSRQEEEYAKNRLQDERNENASLIYELREYQEFIESMPPELLGELKRRHEEQQQRQEQGQYFGM